MRVVAAALLKRLGESGLVVAGGAVLCAAFLCYLLGPSWHWGLPASLLAGFWVLPAARHFGDECDADGAGSAGDGGGSGSRPACSWGRRWGWRWREWRWTSSARRCCSGPRRRCCPCWRFLRGRCGGGLWPLLLRSFEFLRRSGRTCGLPRPALSALRAGTFRDARCSLLLGAFCLEGVLGRSGAL